MGGWVKGFSIKKNAQNELNSNELKIILKATYFFPFLGGGQLGLEVGHIGPEVGHN